MAFGSFTVLAGDFSLDSGACQFLGGRLYMKQRGQFSRETLPASSISSLEVAGQGTAKSFGGAAAAGLAGGLLLGPAGLLAGVLAGGNKNMVTFTMALADGRTCLCSADTKTFQAMYTARYGASSKA